MNTKSATAARRMCLSSTGCDSLASTQVARSAEFGELWETFQRIGGLASGDQMAARMRPVMAQPISQLARRIVARQIVSFEWKGQTLVPLFQFQTESGSLRSGMGLLLQELTPVFDDWELALWFGRGNSRLSGAVPAERLATRLYDVWQAARIDRFIAVGL